MQSSLVAHAPATSESYVADGSWTFEEWDALLRTAITAEVVAIERAQRGEE